MPHPSAQLEKTSPAFLGPDLIPEIKIGDVGNFLPDAKRRILAMNPNRYIKRAEMAREFEMLILRKMLVGEDQHRVFRKRIFDRTIIRGLDWLRQIGVADLSGKIRRDRKNSDSHPPLHNVPLRFDHFSANYAISGIPRIREAVHTRGERRQGTRAVVLIGCDHVSGA